jgi:hypothetical protein
VDLGANVDVIVYVWDPSDNKYVPQAGGNSLETPESINAQYESNDDTNAFTDAEKSKLEGLPDTIPEELTAEEIKDLYESNDDTNAFTDSDKDKLDGIEEGATNTPPLPSYGETDAGKVLAVNSTGTGEEWIELPEPPEPEEIELLDLVPDITGNDGKVLGLVDGGIEWVDLPEAGDEVDIIDLLPDMTGQAGKLIVVNDEENGVEYFELPEIPEPYEPSLIYTVEVLGSSPVTMTATERGKLLESTSGSAVTVRLPLNTSQEIAVGALYTITQIGAGIVTIEAVAGVLLNGVDGASYEISDRWQAATFYKRATDEWVISGAVKEPD